MSSSRNFKINSHDRVFICGKTGSGKSTLVNSLLAPVKRLVVIDPKDSGNKEWKTQDIDSKAIALLSNSEDVRLRVVTLEQSELILNLVYEVGNCIVYIDEITSLLGERNKLPPIFQDIWTRGRSRGIGGWSATQRPVSIPIYFMSESEHFFIFQLNIADDRNRVASFAGSVVKNPVKDVHGFYYYSTRMQHPIYYKSFGV